MPTQTFTFSGHDHQQLVGSLEMPEGTPQAFALFAHCFTCTKDFVASRNIARALAGRGIATLRFDFTGLGNSDGDFGNTGFQGNVADLLAAAHALGNAFVAPSILIGHSLGGAAVLAAAPHIASTVAVATIGAPFDPEHVLHHLGDDIAEIQSEGSAVVKIGGTEFCVSREFLDRTRNQNQQDSIAALRCAMLVMHDPMDDTVNIRHAKTIYDAARHPKSFFSLDDMGHLLHRRADAEYVANVLSSWAARYIDTTPKPARLKASATGKDKDLIVQTNDFTPYGCTIAAREHRILADEPTSVQGQNTGATPFELLISALGACTAMTLKMYAARKKIALDDVRVSLHHERVDDVSVFTRKIALIGTALTPEIRARMMEIADKCPVHRTIAGKVQINSHLKE